MHLCPASDDRLAPRAAWCTTLGECDQIRRADPTGPAGPCRGLVCAHGCQRAESHITTAALEQYAPAARHAAQPFQLAAREATGPPYIGRHRGYYGGPW